MRAPSRYRSAMAGFAKGSAVFIERGAGVRGTVLDSRPGQLRCALESGQTVWVPADQVRAVDGSSPNVGPSRHHSGFPNPYEPPNAHGDADSPRDRRDWKWLLFSFEGRIRRSSYWLGMLISFGSVFASVMLIGVSSALLTSPEEGREMSPILFIPLIAVLLINGWMSLALSVKRWHDRGKSGAWVLINLIPYIGGIWAFVETGCLAGDQESNRFGPPPS